MSEKLQVNLGRGERKTTLLTDQESLEKKHGQRQKKKVPPKKNRKAEARLAEMERRGEAVAEKPTYFGPLPVIRLVKPARLDRIIKLAKH